jgi:CelD/BcsL family acetyltransferase involved in cellulose biosynthesis
MSMPAGGTGTATWAVTPLAGSLGPHGNAWDELNAGMFGQHPLLDSRFINGLLQRFGEGREVLACRRVAGAVDAMCVLVPQGRGVWGSFLPSQAQVGPTLVRAPEQLNGLVRALPGWALQVDLLCCDPRLGRLWAAGRRQAASCHEHAVTISIDLSGEHEAWQQGQQRTLRNNLKRYEKRAASEGQAPRLVRIDEPQAVAQAVGRYAAMEGAGWKGTEGTALGSAPEQYAFYADLMDRFAQRGQAHVFELWHGERMAASRLAIRQGRWLIMLKTTYDEALKDWAPGRILLARVVEHAFQNWPGGLLEFYTNATPDQLSWGVDQRTIMHVSVRRSRALDRFLHAAQSLRHAWGTAGAPAAAKAGLEVGVEPLALGDTPDLDTERLFAGQEARHFQLGLDWWRLFTRTVMASSEGARMFALRRGGRPVAVLPVNFDEGLVELGGMAGALVNFYSTLYAPIANDDVTGLDLLPLVQRLRHDADGKHATLQFEPMDPEAPQTAALEWALAESGYAVERYACSGNWYLPVLQDWDAYLQSRPGELRNTIRRMQLKLQAHEGRVEIVQSPQDLARGLEAFQAVYARSWKRREPLAGFVAELTQMCARRGWLRLGLVWLGDRPVAAQIWVVNASRAMIYKLAYDEDFKRFAPGTVLTAALMRHVIETDRVQEVDFLVGDEPYKKQWMTHRRDRCGLVANDLRSAKGWWGAARQVASRWRRAWPGMTSQRTLEPT